MEPLQQPAAVSNAFGRLRARLAARGDKEHEQAVIRIAIALLISILFVWNLLYGDAARAKEAFATYGVLFLVASALLFAHIATFPAVNPTRRLIGISLDLWTLTVALTISERFAAYLVFIYAWVIVGNGTRFGVRYMVFATVLTFVGFGWVVYTNEYWQRLPELTIGVAGFLLIVPVYCAFLITRLERVNLELKAKAQELELMATRDSLTKLPNRALFFDRLAQATALAERTGQQVVFLYFDLDGFKAVNDHHGHDAGDALLVLIADRIQQQIRNHDTLARFGGDEFVVLLTQLRFPSGVLRVAAAILREIEAIKEVEGHAIDVSASIGIACWPTPEEKLTPLDALKRADAAMYEAKRAGKRRWVVDSTLPVDPALRTGRTESTSAPLPEATLAARP